MGAKSATGGMSDVRSLFGSGKTFLTLGGGETYLLFQQKYPLREFCAFEVLEDERAWAAFEAGFLFPIADAAAENGFGLLTDCMVWRASPDYVERLGHGAKAVARINRLAIDRMRAFVADWRRKRGAGAAGCPVVMAAEVGPRGDGYAIAAGGAVTAAVAADYHASQIAALAEADPDLLVALTMTSVGEAIGIVSVAAGAGIPIVVSPTVETDGMLPDRTPLGEFVNRVDEATSGAPLFYMVNCVHPIHIEPVLAGAADRGAAWLNRFRGLRANASTKSHAELDNSTELDRGDPADLAGRMASLRDTYSLSIVGGCCGTDAEHLRAIAERCA